MALSNIVAKLFFQDIILESKLEDNDTLGNHFGVSTAFLDMELIADAGVFSLKFFL